MNNPMADLIGDLCRQANIPPPPSDPNSMQFWADQWGQACIEKGIIGRPNVHECDVCRDTGMVHRKDELGLDWFEPCTHRGRIIVNAGSLQFPPNIPHVGWRDLPSELRQWRDWHHTPDAPRWLARNDDHLPAHTFALVVATDAMAAGKRVRYINAAQCPGGKRSDPLAWAGPLGMDMLVVGQLDSRISGLKRIYVSEVLVSIPHRTRVLLLTKGQAWGALDDEMESRGACSI